MKREIFDMLDECVEAIINNEKTLEECLVLHTEVRAELEPRLAAVLQLREAGRIKPDGERKSLARERFLAAVEEKAWERGIEGSPAPQAVKEKRRTSLWRRPVLKLGIITMVFAMLSGGTMVMAEESLPGSPLYPMKLAVEKARVGMTFSGEKKAELYLRYASERVDELGTLDIDDENYGVLVSAIARNIGAARIVAGENEQFNAALSDLVRRNKVALQAVLEKVPESAKPAIQRALDKDKEVDEYGASDNDGKIGDDQKDSRDGKELDGEQDELDEGRPASESKQPGTKKSKDSEGSSSHDDGSVDDSRVDDGTESKNTGTTRKNNPGKSGSAQDSEDDNDAKRESDKSGSGDVKDNGDDKESAGIRFKRTNSCVSCKSISPAAE